MLMLCARKISVCILGMFVLYYNSKGASAEGVLEKENYVFWNSVANKTAKSKHVTSIWSTTYSVYTALVSHYLSHSLTIGLNCNLLCLAITSIIMFGEGGQIDEHTRNVSENILLLFICH